MTDIRTFSIHGDNIVECERTLELLLRAFGDGSYAELHPAGSPFAPCIIARFSGLKSPVCFQLLPGFGRWDADILELVRERGGRLREAADAVLCRVDGKKHTPLLALEYCGALPAGNQAWQRSGRAFSFAHARVPYFYIAEIGGFELDSERQRKAERMPNPAVPFSYLMLTRQLKTLALPVFVLSPGASQATARDFRRFIGDKALDSILREVIERGELVRESDDELQSLTLEFVKYLADSRARKDGLSGSEWETALSKVVIGNELPAHLSSANRIKWKKTAYIDGLTDSARGLMERFSSLASGLTSSSLPMCIVAERDRSALGVQLRGLYPNLSAAFLKWIVGRGPLAVCWVMGFKPRGDDARPDRGLPPLCRTLAGPGVDVLTIVYGPAPTDTWDTLERTPARLAQQNGLWESILACSDGVLADAATMTERRRPAAFLRSHWEQPRTAAPVASLEFVGIPQRIGENDVDTVIHLAMARGSGGTVFEGLCNPPGGDWSGISLLTDDGAEERRWLVLPRVTASDAKRPDHVLQFFMGGRVPTIVAIESKDRASAVEDQIGPRLARYVDALLDTPPSVVRTRGAWWRHGPTEREATDRRKSGARSRIVTAAAAQIRAADELPGLLEKAGTDFAVGLTVASAGDSCELHMMARTDAGHAVCAQVASFQTRLHRIKVEVHR